MFALAMLGNKSRELSRGRGFLKSSSTKTDSWCLAVYEKIKTLGGSLKVVTSRKAIIRGVVKFEQFCVKMFSRLANRFTIVGEVMIGGSIPKNRGSVSFFLKNIEASKKQKVHSAAHSGGSHSDFTR